MHILNSKELSQIINLTIASASINNIKTPYYNFRPQIHLMIVGHSGSAKSTILRQIAKSTNTSFTIGLSEATLKGSVDKTTGIPILPVVWEAKNNVVCIDEYNPMPKNPADTKLMELMLTFMEEIEYTRPIAYRINELKEKDKDLFLEMKDNKIKCKSRCSFVFTTMKNIKRTQSPIFSALINRCIVIPHYPSLEDLDKMTEGNKFFTYKKIKTKPNCKVSKKDYDKIKLFIKSNQQVNERNFLRVLGDLIRIYAITKKFDEELFKLIIELKWQFTQ